MEAERIALSQRERDRLKVLHEVKQKHLTQVEAARRLRLGDRQVRRMVLRRGKHGDGAIISVFDKVAVTNPLWRVWFFQSGDSLRTQCFHCLHSGGASRRQSRRDHRRS
jgi:hypothetical protein